MADAIGTFDYTCHCGEVVAIPLLPGDIGRMSGLDIATLAIDVDMQPVHRHIATHLEEA